MTKDIGWYDVTQGITGLVEDQDEDREGSDEEQDDITTPRDERLECARSARSTGEHGSEVQVKIKPPGSRVGHVAKRMFSFITDMAGLAAVPVAGLFLWHASRGVLNSLIPFQG